MQKVEVINSLLEKKQAINLIFIYLWLLNNAFYIAFETLLFTAPVAQYIYIKIFVRR
jgi:hypothetical protein